MSEALTREQIERHLDCCVFEACQSQVDSTKRHYGELAKICRMALSIADSKAEGMEAKPNCSEVPPGNGYCDQCAQGHYELCRYVVPASRSNPPPAVAGRQGEGWVSVPREPTMAQWDDFTKVYPVPFDKFMEAYKAMIARTDGTGT